VPCKDIPLKVFYSAFQDREHKPFFALADILFVDPFDKTKVSGVERNPSSVTMPFSA
jgi:hypothetical protein